MSDRVSALFEELSQLIYQYKNEVPGRRRAWPVSIKERVAELRRSGVTFMVISKKSGISIATLYSWKLKSTNSKFLPVKVVEKKSQQPISTVTVRGKRSSIMNRSIPESAIPTVTVVTRSGLRIEGLGAGDILELIAKIELGGNA